MTGNNLCEQFGNSYHRLVAATMDVQESCGTDGVSMDDVSSISKKHDVELGELLNHMTIVGYKVVEGSILKCPSS